MKNNVEAQKFWITLGGIVTVLLTLSVASMNSAKAAEQRFIAVGTGGVTGVYYPAGAAICRLVNKTRRQHGIRCSVESTGGSVYNIKAMRDDELDLGIAQSDWQFHAYYGTSKFYDAGPYRTLRSVFSIHPEPFTVVARADSGILKFSDLKGKRVNVGNIGSGQRGTMEVLMDALGWTMEDFAIASALKSSEQSTALCDRTVDAIVFSAGHPSASIKEATTTCKSVLVDVTGLEVEQLISDHDYYWATTIPSGMYTGTNRDVKTFGVGATLVASTAVPKEVIYQVVKAVFENFESFKNFHPAFANLKKAEMIADGLSAPLHGGALKYYREVGLLP